MEQWHAYRVRAWSRHGVVLDAEWWDLDLTGGVSAGLIRRFGERGRGGRMVVPAVTAEATIFRFSHGHHDRTVRGQRNPRFLDPEGTARLLDLLLRAGHGNLRLMVLRLPRILPTEQYSLERFLVRLVPWLDALPVGVRYALDLDNPCYWVPEVLDHLRVRGIAPVLRPAAGTAVLDRLQIPGVLDAGHAVVRMDGGDAEMTLAVIETVRRCVERSCPLVLCPAPETADAVAAAVVVLDGDLAKRSLLRRRRAA